MKSRTFFLFLSGLLALPPLAGFAQHVPPSLEIITTFVYPNSHALFTSAEAISNDGKVAGYFMASNGHQYSYVRMPNGKFSPPIKTSDAQQFIPGGINISGTVAGYASGATSGLHGFFYQNGIYTPYDVPGADETLLTGLNDGGNFVGVYSPDNSFDTLGFVSLGGVISTVAPPGEIYTQPRGINSRNEIVGWYQNSTGGNHGFFRNANGVSTGPLDFPGSGNTQPRAINDSGTIVGFYFDSAGFLHGFILQGQSQFTEVDVPGAPDTLLTGINNEGLVSGYYLMDDGTSLCFVGRIR